MEKVRCLIAASLAIASGACGTEVATAVWPPPASTPPLPDAGFDAGTPGVPEKPPQCTSSKITSRIFRSSIPVSDGIRYKRARPFFGFPQDDRVALSPHGNNGSSMVAWLDNTGTAVHVASLTSEFVRSGLETSDTVVMGTDLSGLVALEDGFALLTRRLDPGDPLSDTGTATQATYLVRWKDGHEAFAALLTGTNSITSALDTEKRDYPLGAPSSIGLSGRLAFDGTQYGAYFPVRGSATDRYANTNGDKFVQLDDTGQYVGGFRAACRQDLGGRLIADMGGFITFCMSDGAVSSGGSAAGLNVALGARNSRLLAPEATLSSGNYAGGNIGSAIKLPNGYLVAWASRGVSASNSTVPGHDSHEPAVAIVTKDLRNLVTPAWPFLADSRQEPKQDAVNVHAAPYGDKVLLVWETIESPVFSSNGSSTGTYGGTHFRLIDSQGKIASDEEILLENVAPNGPDDIVQLPNGDLAWAYVYEDRNFQTFVSSPAIASLAPATEIRFVKLSFCTP